MNTDRTWQHADELLFDVKFKKLNALVLLIKKTNVRATVTLEFAALIVFLLLSAKLKEQLLNSFSIVPKEILTVTLVAGEL